MSVAPRPHVMLATPCYGGMVAQAYMQSVLGLTVEAAGAGLPLSIALLGQDALITRSRNTLLARFLRSEASHILFVDADIGFSPADVMRLLGHGVDAVGAPYPIRAHVWDAATMRHWQAGEPLAAASLRYVGEPTGEPAVSGLLPARYAGTGFLLLARPVLERMVAAHPETRCRHSHVASADGGVEEVHALFDCIISENGDYLSEDYAFCARLRGIGGAIWLDPAVRLLHAGMGEFNGRPDLRWSEAVAFGGGAAAGAG